MNSQPINLSYVKLSTNLTGDGDTHHVVHFLDFSSMNALNIILL